MAKIWVDLFEMPQLRGRCRRLFGPGIYKNLRQPSGGVGTMFQSLASGADTFVRLFSQANSEKTIGWLRPNAIVDALDKLSKGSAIDALELSGAPPQPGETGYESFIAFAANAANGN